MTIGSVDGLISGLSTSDLINQLVSVEAGTQTALKGRVNTAQKAVSAMQNVNTKLAALGTAADALTAKTAFAPVSATSTSTAVTATATAGALSGSLTFDVKSLAAAEAHVSDNSYALTDSVASGSSITISKGGVDTAISLSDGRLDTVVSAINASGSGVRAAAVQVSAGQYKLQLTSTTTGAVSDFSVAGLSAPTTEMVAGSDAVLHIGPTVGGYDIASSTNSFSNVLPGVTFTAKRVETNITVDVALDTAAVTTKVKDMVTALNSAVSEIKNQTGKGGTLATESLFRSISASLTGAVAQGVAGTSMSTLGISLDRSGVVNFDEDKFAKAFEADPTLVSKALGQASNFTPDVASSGSISTNSIGHRTVQGDYPVVILQAATQATASYDIPSVTAGETYSVTYAGTTANYIAQASDGIAQVTAGLRAAAGAKGLGISISTSGTSVDVIANAYGSKQLLSLGAAAGATTSSAGGLDVSGTIGGLVGTGNGRTLSTTGVTGNATDINLNVTLTAADLGLGASTGSLKVTAGLGQRLETLAKAASDSYTGSVTTAIERRNQVIKGINDQVAAWDVRLSSKRAALKTQFGNLEVALGKLKNQSSWLSGQIANL